MELQSVSRCFSQSQQNQQSCFPTALKFSAMDRRLVADIREVEDFFCVVSSDSDVEELLLELHAEKKQALALAARARSERLPFSLEHVSPAQAT